MATQYTFAKLTAPAQFRPEEAVTFKLEYSEDLVDTNATLVVDGYTDRLYDTQTGQDVYSYGTIPYKDTHRVNTSMGITWDVGYEEYLIPSGSLGKTPTQDYEGNERYILYINGSCRARVEFRRLGEPDSDPIFVSNSVPVNLLIVWDDELYFDNTPYLPTTSVFTPVLYYLQCLSLGYYDATFINSYRFFLYDNQYNLIEDSGELYDWNSYIYLNNPTTFSFNGLKDDRTYYVKAKVTLNGGYVFWRGYEPVVVNYSVPPAADEELQLSNTMSGVKVEIDLSSLTYDRVVITRTVDGADVWLQVKDLPNIGDSLSITDHLAITKTRYQYHAVIYNGNAIVANYNNYINHVNNNIVISDSTGSYTAVGNITKYPISRNDRGQALEAMDNKYPYVIINGLADYDSGTLDAIFAEVDECEADFDNQDYSSILRAWLNNGHAKLLTYYTGESWIVSVSNIQTTDPENRDVLNTTFNWTQIGDAYKIESYPKYGLVVTNDG